MFILYVFNILDRTNTSAAVLTMPKDLGFTNAQYGLGAGIFYLGYFLFEVPSNLILEKVGARRWIARIMLSWGIVASAMMFSWNIASFSAFRFLLGVAEAGFFPGMVIYLTYWFPAVIRARAAARFMVATTVGGIFGGPIAALLMQLNGTLGLRGWQWLFLIEGIPSVLLGFAVLYWLTDKPEDATWLNKDEKQWLMDKLHKEKTERMRHHDFTLWGAFKSPKVLYLVLFFFVLAMANGGYGTFASVVLRERSGWSNGKVLLLGSIPGILGAIAQILASNYSDRTRERRKFVSIGHTVGAMGIWVVAIVKSPFATLSAQSVQAVGGNAANAPFWALATSFLSGTASAGGIAFINSVGNLGGFFAPWIMGRIKDKTGSFELGIYLTAATYLLAAFIASHIRHDKKVEYGEE
jgi:ACS family tartrate transporter-like MFS transporter